MQHEDIVMQFEMARFDKKINITGIRYVKRRQRSTKRTY